MMKKLIGAATKVILFLFLNIAFVNVSWSQDYKLTPSASNKFDWEHPIGSVSICSTKDMMGFQWANNDWRRAAFHNKSFIFRKLSGIIWPYATTTTKLISAFLI